MNCHEPLNGTQDLVPLPSATELLYLNVHGAPPPEEHLVERLNGLAYVIAEETVLYTFGGNGVKPISKELLKGGFFRHGARELHFLDERLPIRDIGVTREGVEKTAVRLINAIEHRSPRSGRNDGTHSAEEMRTPPAAAQPQVGKRAAVAFNWATVR